MIARTSLKTMLSRSAQSKVGLLRSPCDHCKRFSSSFNNDNSKASTDKKIQASKKSSSSSSSSSSSTSQAPPDIPSFMPVVNIPEAELAHNAFYSLHRPLLGLSIPRPFLVGGIVGQIKEDNNDSEEALLQYMTTLKPFEPPALNTPKEEKSTTTTLTVEVDPSYFMNHNNNHDEIADYLTAMQEKLDLLYDERQNSKRKFSATPNFIPSSSATKKKTRRLRKRKGFFEKN